MDTLYSSTDLSICVLLIVLLLSSYGALNLTRRNLTLTQACVVTLIVFPGVLPVVRNGASGMWVSVYTEMGRGEAICLFSQTFRN